MMFETISEIKIDDIDQETKQYYECLKDVHQANEEICNILREQLFTECLIEMIGTNNDR